MGCSSNIKAVIVGDQAVGKTCLIISYATREFPKNQVPTVFDNYVVTITVEGDPKHLLLFDTAGQEQFVLLRKLAYHGTHVFLLCFSVVEPSSYRNIRKIWIKEIRQECPKACIILVGTKADLRNDADILKTLKKVQEEPITAEQGVALAAKIGAETYTECSALTSSGLNDVFSEALMAVLNTRREDPPKTPPTQSYCCLRRRSDGCDD